MVSGIISGIKSKSFIRNFKSVIVSTFKEIFCRFAEKKYFGIADLSQKKYEAIGFCYFFPGYLQS